MASVENGGLVRLQPTPAGWVGGGTNDALYQCDQAFGREADQERLFTQIVVPICESVTRGFNGAVIAYGQTGSGKTHTMIGDAQGPGRGMALRSVAYVFDHLQQRQNWEVEVSVLEIYNEKVRDLLAPGEGVTIVGVHENRMDGQCSSFWCPDAVQHPVKDADEACNALLEGMQRREVARTDMNHNSSRSHLVFTLSVRQWEPALNASIRSRLHLVDLAGSERLKRSMASEDRLAAPPPASRGKTGPSQTWALRKEACEINKSLSQLALVIQRLTSSGANTYVPYRDSTLTRLLADSFGGNSKTCLIITCSASAKDREETRNSLELGKRAKLIRNRAEVNIDVASEISDAMRSSQELAEMQRERDILRLERDTLDADKRTLESAASVVTESLREALEEQRRLGQRLSEVTGAAESVNIVEVQLREERDRLLEMVAKLTEERDHARQLAQVSRSDAREPNSTLDANSTLEDERSRLERDLQAALRDVNRYKEELAQTAQRAREEKTVLVAKLEEEKLALRRQFHDEVAKLRENPWFMPLDATGERSGGGRHSSPSIDRRSMDELTFDPVDAMKAELLRRSTLRGGTRSASGTPTGRSRRRLPRPSAGDSEQRSNTSAESRTPMLSSASCATTALPEDHDDQTATAEVDPWAQPSSSASSPRKARLDTVPQFGRPCRSPGHTPTSADAEPPLDHNLPSPSFGHGFK